MSGKHKSNYGFRLKKSDRRIIERIYPWVYLDGMHIEYSSEEFLENLPEPDGAENYILLLRRTDQST